MVSLILKAQKEGMNKDRNTQHSERLEAKGWIHSLQQESVSTGYLSAEQNAGKFGKSSALSDLM